MTLNFTICSFSTASFCFIFSVFLLKEEKGMPKGLFFFFSCLSLGGWVGGSHGPVKTVTDKGRHEAQRRMSRTLKHSLSVCLRLSLSLFYFLLPFSYSIWLWSYLSAFLQFISSNHSFFVFVTCIHFHSKQCKQHYLAGLLSVWKRLSVLVWFGRASWQTPAPKSFADSSCRQTKKALGSVGYVSCQGMYMTH